MTDRVPRTDLPVEDAVDAVRAALAGAGAGAGVLVAPPGAGKTTVVPLRLLDEPWLAGGRIVLLEPRRLAARAAARRIAELLGEPVGRRVGYRTRDERVGGRGVRIEVVTEGILVRRLQRDPELAGTGLVILDEVHERNLTTDLSLALTLDARAALRPDLRVLAMSATVDAGRLAAVLGGAPVVASAGRQHPVTIRWHPPGPRDRPERHLARVVAGALRDEPAGDVLAFLPGAAEIGRAVRALRELVGDGVDVWPLHGSLPVADQDRALAPSPPGRRRVVVATDIAESSLTVDGVRIVVDAGLARAPRFDPGTGLTRLVTEPASRAAADQRAGRAGRLAPGVAHRLWSEADHRRRPAFPEPEIAAVDLAGFALELAVWGAAPADLPLVDQPPAAAWSEAVALLRLLGALDGDGRPTAAGRELAGLPLHPRLAHLLVTAAAGGHAWTGALLAALLDGRDVLGGRRDERPADLVERLRAVADDRSAAGAVTVDREAAATVRRRAAEHLRRLGVAGAARTLAPDRIAALVAAAHPDRLAQARGGGGFRFRDGGGGWLPDTDPLAGADFLAVAEVDAAGTSARPGGVGSAGGPGGPGGPGAPGARRDGRIRQAGALDRAEVEDLLGPDRTVVDELRWDERGDDLRRHRTESVGALVLRRRTGRPEPGPDTVAALLDRVRDRGLDALRWSPAARSLRARLGFVARLPGADADRWPEVGDEALLATLDAWLAPHLVDATGRGDLHRVDLAVVLGARLGWDDRRELDRLAPTTVDLPNGRRLSVDYADAERGPLSSVRVQDLYGVTEHPSVGGGAVPVVLELLSPAARPVQVTADLPGFWAGSWREVRKEMAGRYPKHDWPTDPATARPPEPHRRRR